jgi:elongator complex protein 3
MGEKEALKELARAVVSGKVRSKHGLHLAKAKVSRKYKLGRYMRDADLLQYVPASKQTEKVLQLLKKKPSRTLSGVSIVSVMTKPSPCPHGRCIYCPGGTEIHTPQSYTGREPAAMRGIQYGFDPREQTARRIEQLEAIGHACDKIELIVMGGTLTAQPLDYQRKFVKGCFDAMNGRASRTLPQAQKLNEKAKYRCIGLTIETRPDWCKQKEINDILEFGATRVELGVQNPDDEIYKLVKRGHTVGDVAESTQLLKDSFLKVGYHIMPGLPGSTPEKDLKMFRSLFSDERFMPDMLKIYPCLLVKPEFSEKSGIYDLYKRGEWAPYDDEQAAELIADAKRYFPKWVRVMRIQRDIPSPLILAGVKHSNLRQLIADEMARKKIKCRCVRCREIRARRPKKAELTREDYKASGGNEIFLSFEDTKQDALLALLRLRIPSKPFRPEIDEDTAGIRELHVYGPLVKIGAKPKWEPQHRGLGEKLLREAERIAADEFGKEKMAICSGVGVREYYRKFGYRLEGPYMSKKI